MSAMFWVKNMSGDLIYIGKFPKLTDDARTFLKNMVGKGSFKGFDIDPESELFNEDNLEITKELIEASKGILGAESKRLANNYHKRSDEWSNSEMCKEMGKRIRDLEKLKSKEHDKMYRKQHEITENYLEVRPYSGGWYSPRASMSVTYGKNVKPQVLDAIKKAFEYKKLSGGAIEDIVNKMIQFDIDNDKSIQESKEKQRQLQIEINTGQNIRSKKKKSFMEGFSTSGGFLKQLIDDLNVWVASKQFKEGDSSMKDSGISTYNKKRIREKYRSECVSNFKKAYNQFHNIKVPRCKSCNKRVEATNKDTICPACKGDKDA